MTANLPRTKDIDSLWIQFEKKAKTINLKNPNRVNVVGNSETNKILQEHKYFFIVGLNVFWSSSTDEIS